MLLMLPLLLRLSYALDAPVSPPANRPAPAPANRPAPAPANRPAPAPVPPPANRPASAPVPPPANRPRSADPPSPTESLRRHLENVNVTTAPQNREEEVQCVICRDSEPALRNDALVTLTCGHRLHATCWSQARTRRNRCPICRARQRPIDSDADLISFYDFEEANSNDESDEQNDDELEEIEVEETELNRN